MWPSWPRTDTAWISINCAGTMRLASTLNMMPLNVCSSRSWVSAKRSPAHRRSATRGSRRMSSSLLSCMRRSRTELADCTDDELIWRDNSASAACARGEASAGGRRGDDSLPRSSYWCTSRPSTLANDSLDGRCWTGLKSPDMDTAANGDGGGFTPRENKWRKAGGVSAGGSSLLLAVDVTTPVTPREKSRVSSCCLGGGWATAGAWWWCVWPSWIGANAPLEKSRASSGALSCSAAGGINGTRSAWPARGGRRGAKRRGRHEPMCRVFGPSQHSSSTPKNVPDLANGENARRRDSRTRRPATPTPPSTRAKSH